MSGPDQTISVSLRLEALERRVEALERALRADAPQPREDDPDTPLFDEATGNYRKPGGAP